MNTLIRKLLNDTAIEKIKARFRRAQSSTGWSDSRRDYRTS